MSVSNGQIANQQTFNDAFVSKQALAEVVDGTINLENGSSGAVVTNVQQVINNILIVNANQDSSITNLENSRVVNSPTATDEALVRFDGTTGQSIQNSLVTVNDVGNIFTPGNIEGEDLQVNGDLIVDGNFTVNGTTTFINTTDLEVTDRNILVNKNGTDGTSEGAGLTVERDGTFGSFIYGDAFQNKFACGPLGAELPIATINDITAAAPVSVQSSTGSADANKFIKTNSDGFLDKTFNNTIPTFATEAAFVTALGRAAIAGDRFFDTTTQTIKVHNGTVFVSASSSTAVDASYEISNLTLACSVSSNALTIAVKTKATTDATVSDSIKVGMRSSTLTSGAYNQRSITSALSIVISSGSTLGHASAIAHNIFVYLLDNAGTLELAVSTTLFPENGVISTTAEGGAGASDSNRVVYSTVARSNVPFRLIGRLVSTQTTAGTWAVVPTNTSVGISGTIEDTVISARYFTTAGQSIPNTGDNLVTFATRSYDTHNAWNGTTFTVPLAGKYRVSSCLWFQSALYPAGNGIFTSIYKNGSIYSYGPLAVTGALTGVYGSGITDSVDCIAGDTLDVRTRNARSGGATSLDTAGNTTYVAIERIG